MLRIILCFIVFALFQSPNFCQTDSTEILNRISDLETKHLLLDKNIKKVLENQKSLSVRLDTLRNITDLNSRNIETTAKQLGIKIEKTESHSKLKFEEYEGYLSKSNLIIMITFLVFILLILSLYIYLTKRNNIIKNDMFDAIKRTKSELEEESIKLDTKLMEVLTSQIELMKNKPQSPVNDNQEKQTDHSLALRVADNIARIKTNLNHMDPNVKGYKQLSQATNAIIDNFKANGYEIVDLLNKPYDPGMKLTANMEPDEKLKPGEHIIKRIIKPQVNYNGIMIQSAQVVVAYGEEE